MYLTEVGHFCFTFFTGRLSPCFLSKGSGGDGNIDGKKGEKKKLGECSARGEGNTQKNRPLAGYEPKLFSSKD